MKTPKSKRIQFLALAAIFTIAVLHSAHAQTDPPPLGYDNLDDIGFYFGGGPPDPKNGGVAQRFTAGEVGALTSVTLEVRRKGLPGGKLIVSVWDVDPVSGNPRRNIGTLAELEINSLPLITDNKLPLVPQFVTAEGSVTGLTPGVDYYLVLEHNNEVNLTPDIGWVIATASSPDEASPILRAISLGSNWRQSPQGYYLYARIGAPGETTPGPIKPPVEAVTITQTDFDPTEGLTLTWMAQIDRTYRIEYKDVLDSDAWSIVPRTEELIASNSIGSYQIFNEFRGWSRNNPSRFYRVVVLPSNPDIQIFTDEETGYRTTSVHDVNGDVVRLNTREKSLIWDKNRKSYSKGEFPVLGGVFLKSNRFFQVRFGTQGGQRKAFFTERGNGTICDIRLSGEELRIFATSARVPNN